VKSKYWKGTDVMSTCDAYVSVNKRYSYMLDGRTTLPSWFLQIFPLVEYCAQIGQLYLEWPNSLQK
jgi:hypothetical protein